ncbi:hypothetical protein BT93_H2391 [Corymbia citriodora subsp. variegata]|nr:hypothetical protein BT93_H2391 [Corymbia citriodora subsp. variegata]
MNLAFGLHDVATMMAIPLDCSNVLFTCIKNLSLHCRTSGATCYACMVTASNRTQDEKPAPILWNY